MLSPPESKVDVLIVGAGPAGLMAANALVQAGIDVRIIDKRAVGISVGHADGIHPRTTEVLESYGLGERLMQEGARFYRATFWNPGPDGGVTRTQRTPAIYAPTARYPFLITRHQGGIEALFLDSMQSKGLVVQRSTVPTAIQLSEIEAELQDPCAYPVKVTLRRVDLNENATEIVNAKFVLGADGAHSWVRNALGIRMDGDQSESIWGVVDMYCDTDFPDSRNWTFLHSNHGTLMNIPREGDLMRYYIQLSEDSDFIDPRTGRIDRTRARPERLVETAAKIFQPYYLKQVDDIQWWTIYIIGQRVAQNFSVEDRIFIAGDACHTHSPKAGQGMNASMNDSHNLAWKLAYVIRGWADMSLLKTYEAERLKYARDLIDFDKTWSKLFTGKPRTEENQGGTTHEEFQGAFMKFNGFASGIGVHYEPSMITRAQHQAYATKLVVGERMIPHTFVQAADIRPVNIHDHLPSDTRFKLLVFIGDLTQQSVANSVQALAENLDAPEGVLRRYGHCEDHQQVFDILCICATSKDVANHTDVPKVLRPHWSKVLLDETDMQEREGGGGFAAYGIDPGVGAIVIVRPDGYVGMIAPYERLDDIDEYFSSFMFKVS